MRNALNLPLHDNEIPVDTNLVRKLVDSQFSRYADLPIDRLGASGSSNVLFRLGEDLLVRIPRQPGGGVAIDKELDWVPEIDKHLTVDVPKIVAVGEPAFGYGERWSIVRWLNGELPSTCALDGPPRSKRSKLATDLADTILALRAVEVPEAAATDPSLRWYRGGALAEFDGQTRRNIRQCGAIEGLNLDLDAVLAIWESSLTLPGAHKPAADRWYHSDLVAENLLVTNDRLSGVLDFGGLGIGDPTIDLHGAWELFDGPARDVFRRRLLASDAEWLRGRAWALAIALGCFTYYWDKMPGRRRDRLAMVQGVLADATAEP